VKKTADQKIVKTYGTTILVAITIAVFIRFFVIEPFRIPTASMRPTLEPGETIFVSKWPFGFRLPFFQTKLTPGRAPTRGEVILMTHPEDSRLDLIKRVIGLEGDVVQLKEGRVILNGKPLEVKIRDAENCGSETLPDGKSYGVCWEPPALEDFGPQKVPPGSIFVLGDFRTGVTTSASLISSPEQPLPGVPKKSWGVFPMTVLKGQALWVWLSIQPQILGDSTGWFPRFRFERMFRRIE
jgi:signal peptidase I